MTNDEKQLLKMELKLLEDANEILMYSYKQCLIHSAEVFKNIRRLRNDIAHEYVPKVIEKTFKNVLELTPYLIGSVDKIKKYSTKYLA